MKPEEAQHPPSDPVADVSYECAVNAAGVVSVEIETAVAVLSKEIPTS